MEMYGSRSVAGMAPTFTRHHRHDDGGAGGGALDENGEEHSDHEAHHRVAQHLVALEHTP